MDFVNVEKWPSSVIHYLNETGTQLLNHCGNGCKGVYEKIAETDTYGTVTKLTSASSGYFLVETLSSAIKSDVKGATLKLAGAGALALIASTLNRDVDTKIQSIAFVSGIALAAVPKLVSAMSEKYRSEKN